MKEKREKANRYDRIFTYFKENLIVVIPMCVTALIFNALMCLVPRVEGLAIDSLNEGDGAQTLRLALCLLGLVLFVQLNRFCKRYLVRVFGNKIALTMRKKSLYNLLNKDLSYYSQSSAGDILNRNLSDIYDTAEGIRKMTTEAFDTIVLLLGYLISMFFMDVKLTLYVSIFLILSILSAELMKRFVYKTNKEYKEYLSENKQKTIYMLNNELYFRGFGASGDYLNDYRSSAETLRKKNTKALLFKSSLEPLYMGVAFIGLIFIIYFGGKNVIDGVYPVGTLSAYITTYALVAKKAAKTGKVFNAYQGFKVSWARCKIYLKDEHVPVYTEEITGDVLKLSSFTYSYGDGFRLPEINLKCRKGEIIGVCGRVHTGKSTLLKALTGLYPYTGEATLGGVDLLKAAQNERQYIGYCPADAAMFSDTLENNIALKREGDMEKALHVSRLDADLENIGGLQAEMAHTNSNISGGQQKRVQMARALYSNPRLILLDDPFRSVSRDMADEMAQALKEYKDETVILVSNNPDILKHADRVIYLEENAVYIDTYPNLLRSDGFKRLMEAN